MFFFCSSDDEALLSTLGLESNETVLVEEATAPAPLQQQQFTPGSPAAAPATGRAADGAAPYRKGDHVECYSAVDGAWVAADIISVIVPILSCFVFEIVRTISLTC